MFFVSPFQQRFLQVIALQTIDCLVPGHHSSRHFSALAGNVTLCRKAVMPR